MEAKNLTTTNSTDFEFYLFRYFFYTTVFFIYYLLFFNKSFGVHGALGNFPSDNSAHLNYTLKLSLNMISFLKDPEVLFHFPLLMLGYFLSWLTQNDLLYSLKNACALLMTGAKCLYLVITVHILSHQMKWSNRYYVYGAALALNLCATLYLPMITTQTYLVTGSPNLFHNPTTIVLKPFALLFFIYYAEAQIVDMKISQKTTAILSTLFLLCTLIKPVFSICMGMASVLFSFFKFHKWTVDYFKQNFIIYLPSAIVTIYQYYLVTYQTGLGKIAFAPFKIIKFYNPHLVWVFIQAFLFPLLVLGYQLYRKKKLSTFFKLAWIYMFFAYTQFAFFTFTGAGWRSGDLGWTYEIGLTLIYFFSFIEFFRSELDLTSKFSQTVLITFFLCLLSGIHRFVLIFMGGPYG